MDCIGDVVAGVDGPIEEIDGAIRLVSLGRKTVYVKDIKKRTEMNYEQYTKSYFKNWL